MDYNKAIKLAIKSIKDFNKNNGFRCCGSKHGIKNIKIDGELWQVQINITKEENEFLPFMKGLNKSTEVKNKNGN